MALTQYWRRFVDDYGGHQAYWFFPKGRQVDTPEFARIVRVFAEFDGKPWDPPAILKRLQQEQLSGGDLAVPRMIKRPIENMGLCVIDEHRGIFVTPLGRLYLDSGGDKAVLERHLWRYRIANPLNPRTQGIDLFPHAFLIQVMLESDNHVAHDEFVLFVSRARRPDEVDAVVDRIARWRRLRPERRQEIKAALPGLYGTIEDNSTYAMGFHRCAPYVRLENRSGGSQAGLGLDPARTGWLRTKVGQQRAAGVRIDYGDKTDWAAAFGDTERQSTAEDAVDHYLDVSRPAKAVEAFKRLPPAARGGLTVAEFERAAFLEKDLEDYLEKHLELIEPGLTPERGGRQVRIGAWSLDLFARAPGGDLVVIELKKVRASDKVFGQICRYIGWITAHYAKPRQRVRGYIIATEMDEKLRYAARVAPRGVIRMKTFHRDSAAGIFIES